MCILTYESEALCTIPPSRIFKAIVFDFNDLLIKVMPEVVKSVDLLHGDGGVGTVKQINFHEGMPIKNLKERVEAIDEEKLFYSYTVIEGGMFKGVEKIQNDVTFEASSDGAGTIMKRKSHYYKIGDNQIDEEPIKAGDEKATGLFKALEAYLLANPHA